MLLIITYYIDYYIRVWWNLHHNDWQSHKKNGISDKLSYEIIIISTQKSQFTFDLDSFWRRWTKSLSCLKSQQFFDLSPGSSQFNWNQLKLWGICEFSQWFILFALQALIRRRAGAGNHPLAFQSHEIKMKLFFLYNCLSRVEKLFRVVVNLARTSVWLLWQFLLHLILGLYFIKKRKQNWSKLTKNSWFFCTTKEQLCATSFQGLFTNNVCLVS